MKQSNYQASEWVRTDAAACRSDIDRLGMDGAVEYQLSLIADRQAAGDTRWEGVSSGSMRRALRDVQRMA